ncbi:MULTISPECIES: SRPBCC family protein [unclassified Frankia]|uniref:SRPBCC family protein n=1 Tax=unclassified Frankia TaxID=2632575 RepID=UPI001EF43341|nr:MULTISPECIES: SRPBCC family protein [unclassified Frankia]
MSSRRRVFVVTETSGASPSVVFDLLADGEGWSRWAGPLVSRSRWEREGTPAPGGVGAIRRLGRPPLYVREEIVEYVPGQRHAYRMRSALPVRDYLGTVDLSPLDSGGTQIVWQGSFVPLIPGTGAVVVVGVRLFVARLAHRLAKVAIAGTGTSSPAT